MSEQIRLFRVVVLTGFDSPSTRLAISRVMAVPGAQWAVSSTTAGS